MMLIGISVWLTSVFVIKKLLISYLPMLKVSRINLILLWSHGNFFLVFRGPLINKYEILTRSIITKIYIRLPNLWVKVLVTFTLVHVCECWPMNLQFPIFSYLSLASILEYGQHWILESLCVVCNSDIRF